MCEYPNKGQGGGLLLKYWVLAGTSSEKLTTLFQHTICVHKESKDLNDYNILKIGFKQFVRIIKTFSMFQISYTTRGKNHS